MKYLTYNNSQMRLCSFNSVHRLPAPISSAAANRSLPTTQRITSTRAPGAFHPLQTLSALLHWDTDETWLPHTSRSSADTLRLSTP